MIPVKVAKEPPSFDELVRKKGADAIRMLTGKPPKKKRPGRPIGKKAATPGTIRPEDFPPYWRHALPDMLGNYGRLCAYLALFIEEATGAPSVDHVLPKSKHWKKVYEWSNYRLSCGRINAKKNNLDLALDPFAIKPGWFALELVEFQVVPAKGLSAKRWNQVDDTITTLGLSLLECCNARRTYVENYKLGPGNGGIDLKYLERRAPFVAQELRRQGHLVRGDK